MSLLFGALLLMIPGGASAAEVTHSDPAPKVQVQQQELDLHAVEAQVVEHTNRQRARYGLRPLRVDFGLIRSARRHTQWMTRNHAMQHSAGVPENIAMGQSSPTEGFN